MGEEEVLAAARWPKELGDLCGGAEGGREPFPYICNQFSFSIGV